MYYFTSGLYQYAAGFSDTALNTEINEFLSEKDSLWILGGLFHYGDKDKDSYKKVLEKLSIRCHVNYLLNSDEKRLVNEDYDGDIQKFCSTLSKCMPDLCVITGNVELIINGLTFNVQAEAKNCSMDRLSIVGEFESQESYCESGISVASNWHGIEPVSTEDIHEIIKRVVQNESVLNIQTWSNYYYNWRIV